MAQNNVTKWEETKKVKHPIQRASKLNKQELIFHSVLHRIFHVKRDSIANPLIAQTISHI